MSQENPIRIFVAHAFHDHDDYLRVFEYLESTTNFFYSNSAAPDRIPMSGGKEAMKDELREQMKPAEAVIVPAGLYEEFRELAEFIIHAAKAFNKPVIVMEHFGSTRRIAPEVSEHADETVGWNDRMIVDALRRQARHEDTQRWDVVEFDL